MDRNCNAAGGPGGLVMTVRGIGVICLVTLAAPASAQELAPEVLAIGCYSCHGPDGQSPADIPAIDTLDAETLAGKLHSFASGETETTIMGRIARGYTDDQIDALARYIAQPE